MGQERQQAVCLVAGSDSHHFLYHQHLVQLFETAVGHHLRDNYLVHRGFPYLLPVRAELRPRRLCLVVLLCGITVNASIYILNEYNAVRLRYRTLAPVRAFVKAWNAKIIPIFLTVVSTILGFIPFMVGTGKEAFWFPLSAGTIGGLLMSILGIFIFLPVSTLKKK